MYEHVALEVFFLLLLLFLLLYLKVISLFLWLIYDTVSSKNIYEYIYMKVKLSL
jgi:hypothetical protein